MPNSPSDASKSCFFCSSLALIVKLLQGKYFSDVGDSKRRLGCRCDHLAVIPRKCDLSSTQPRHLGESELCFHQMPTPPSEKNTSTTTQLPSLQNVFDSTCGFASREMIDILISMTRAVQAPFYLRSPFFLKSFGSQKIAGSWHRHWRSLCWLYIYVRRT